MALANGPNMGILTFGLPGEAHYLNLMAQWRALDFWLNPRVVNATTNAPPGSPVNGDAYIIGPSPTGAWAARANQIARWTTDLTTPAWEYFIPKSGWTCYNIATTVMLKYSGSTWAGIALSLINVQRMTASGTYTPTPGAIAGILDLVGGGGGGGGALATGAGQISAGTGGGSGAYTRAYIPALSATAVVIGAAGAGGAGGGASSFGAITAPGGNPGQQANVSAATGGLVWGGAGPTAPGVGGNIWAFPGAASRTISIFGSTPSALGGDGANSPLGAAGLSGAVLSNNGDNASPSAYGAGGAGASNNSSQGAKVGGSGGPGVMIMTEYG